MEGSGAREWLEDPTVVLGRKEGNETDAPENCKAQEVAYSRVQQAPKRWPSVSGASADGRFTGLGMEAGTRRQRKRR